MKKIVSILLMSALLPLAGMAQKEKANSHFGLSIEGGFSHLFLGKNLSPLNGYSTPELGYGGGGALFYEVEYKHFIFRTGFGVDYTINNSRFTPPDYTATIVEYPGMQYHYTFPSFHEKTHYGVGYVPVMFGGNFSKAFFLIGAKIGVLPFYSQTQSDATVRLWATDDDVIDPMEGLYTHYMREYALTGNATKLDFNQLNIMGSFEVGLNLNSKSWKEDRELRKEARDKKNGKRPKKKPLSRAERYKQLHQKKSFKDCLHYRLSLFADYGVYNMLSATRPTADVMQFNGLTDITPQTMYNYTAHKDAVLHNCLVGLKFTIQYEVPHKAPKKGDMANPYLVTFVRDELTQKPLGGSTVTTQSVTPPGKKPKKPVVKTTDSKYGRVAKSYAPGDYFISASHPGYFPVDSVLFTHQDAYDTLRLDLYPQQQLQAQVVDAKSGRAIAAKITVYDENGVVISQAQVDSAKNAASCAVDDRKQYSVCGSAEGYHDTCMAVNDLKKMQSLQLEPVVVKRFVLKNMHFATDKTKILPSSEKALRELYTFMVENPTTRILIVGHTDDVGSDAYNQRLSEGRSASVKREMVVRGIDANRMETEGHGEKDPIVPNDSDAHRQENRRVEIVILSR